MHGRPNVRAPLGRGVRAAAILARVIDAAAAVACRLPTRLVVPLAVFGGHVEWALRPRLRRQLATNLAHAVGADPSDASVRRLVRREIVNEARRSADLLWAIGRLDAFRESVVIEGAEHTARAGHRGDGVVLVGIHLGGWEVATPVPAMVVPVPTHVVTANDWLAWAIDHVRARAGLRSIPATAVMEPLRVLRRGDCLLMLGDNALEASTRTHPVDFCDGRARLPSGPVTLARLAGSPIVAFDVVPIAPRRWRVILSEPIEPPRSSDDEVRVLQILADRWTSTIRAHPDQWAARFAIDWEPA